MSFSDLMATNPPRLVILFRRAHDGSEQFQWGVVGAIPVLTLIGHIVQVQADITGDEWVPECDELALVIAVDEDRNLVCYKHPDIPDAPLLGMLETIKSILVASRMAQHAGANNLVLGPDGRPIMRN